MKHIPKFTKSLPAVLLGVAIAGGASSAFAITDYVFSTFDSDASAAKTGGGASQALDWAETVGNPAGSALFTVNWADNTTGWQDSKLLFPVGWPGVDFPLYINLELDVKVDQANSYPDANGTYGSIQFVAQGWSGWGLNTEAYNWSSFGGSAVILATNGWQHVQVPLSGFPHTLSQLVMNFFSNGPRWCTNTIKYYVDNVKLTAPPAPPPTLSLVKTPPAGLTCMASRSGDTYQRQMVRTANGTYSWNTATAQGPTTSYAMTITNFPGPAYSGFIAQMFLIPEYVSGVDTVTNMPWGPGDGAIDWNAGNVIFWTIGIDTNGQAYSDWRYKTNCFGSHTMIYNEADGGQYGTNGYSKGHLATLGCTNGPLGTWTMSFNNNTSVTLTAPNGASTNFTIGAEAADIWKDPMYAYFGVQPNSNARIGQSATFSRIQIAGVTSPINDDFSAGGTWILDTATWGKAASAASGIFVTPPDAKYWLYWTTPAPGFTTVWASDNASKSVVNEEWLDTKLGSSTWITVGEQNMVVLSGSTLSNLFGAVPSQCYFSLFKRTGVKLQVLLPGETAAPGTPSGKTGTPTAQPFGVPFDVTVNLVDATWHLVPANDTVLFTTTDTTAYLPGTPAGQTTLVNGTGTLSGFFFGSTGSFTLTATDTSDATIAAGTSAVVSSVP